MIEQAPKKSEKVSSGRVNINTIIDRIRKERQKETLTNLVSIGIALSLIFIVAIILSF
jgi:hypothetical protein